MISLTRREFDAVSTALLEALAKAEQREPVAETGFRPYHSLTRRDPAASFRRTARLVASVR